MRFLFLASLMIAGILAAVLLMQKGQARIAAETATTTTADAKPSEPTGQSASGAVPPAAKDVSTASVQVATAAGAPAPEAIPDAGAAARDPTVVKAPATEPAAPPFQVVAKPAIVAAGILEITRGRVTLKDITPLDPAESCGAQSAAWPCGQLATTQFRRFLRGRSVNCDIADPAWEGEVVARCMLGKQDLGAWLVENGWARAQAGSPYEEAGRMAEAEKRGIFGPDPRHP